MVDRKPNGPEKLLNFVMKIFDPVSKSYKPCYIAPDATDEIQGDVLLSDAVNSELDAAEGMTAATPKAVKTVQDNANNKLDKISTNAQSVKSSVTFENKVTGDSGFVGDLEGNATSSDSLSTPRIIAVKAGIGGTEGSAQFDGKSNINITIPDIDATKLTGIIPIANMPQGALERLIHVPDENARFALTEDDIQLGDSVLQDDEGVIYIVVDINNLDNVNGYQEYKASTALHALEADHALKADVSDKLTTDTIGAENKPIFLNGGVATASSSNIGSSVKALYMKNGELTELENELNVNIPVPPSVDTLLYFLRADGSWALLQVMEGATEEEDGATGFVPVPLAGEQKLVLNGDGTWNKVSYSALEEEIGTIAVSQEKPTDPHVKIWIKA